MFSSRMPSKGRYTEAPPLNGRDMFYNPPVMRQEFQEMIYHQRRMQHQLAQQQQNRQQNQRRQHPRRATVKRRDGGDSSNDDAALSIPRSVSSAASNFEVTNLDRLMESVSPFIQAQYLSEVNKRGSKTREVDSHPFFYLEDLWESFVERSAYGVGVPLLLYGTDPTDQYYVPYLSGIQLYFDPSKSSSRLRVPNEDSDALQCMPAGTSNIEGGRKPKPLMNSNVQQFNKLSLEDNSSNSEADIAKSPVKPDFSFLEKLSPHLRKPLALKINSLCKEYPDLARLRSCDLLPTSWMCIAWYPIYRIPMGSTLQDLDASFLSFHSLSTQPKSNSPAQFHAPYTRSVNGFVDPGPSISLPVFALAAYKLKGSIVSPCGPHELEQEKSLEQAADSWLRHLKVQLPDYNFFRTHSHPMR